MADKKSDLKDIEPLAKKALELIEKNRLSFNSELVNIIFTLSHLLLKIIEEKDNG